MCICCLTCKRSAWVNTMSSDTRILRLMIIYNVSGYSVLGNPLIRDPRRRLHGKAISCVANQWKGSREMQVGDAWQRQEETGSREIGKEEREEEWGEASECEKHRVRRDRKKGQGGVREGEGTSSGNHRGVSSVPPTRLRRPVCHSFELISWMFHRLSRTL